MAARILQGPWQRVATQEPPTSGDDREAYKQHVHQFITAVVARAGGNGCSTESFVEAFQKELDTLANL